MYLYEDCRIYILPKHKNHNQKDKKLLIADCIKSMEVRRMRPKPKMNPLDKRIKPNPKYSKVVSFCFYPHMLCCYNFPERWNLQ